MVLEYTMTEVFGRENLVCANPDRLCKISLPNETREFVLNVGLPRLVYAFRFSMDFEPISEDIEIGKLVSNLSQVFTIGCKSGSLVVGRMLHLSELGLGNNASLSDIARQRLALKMDDFDVMFNEEVVSSYRICIDVENNSRIISIDPQNPSVSFFNSTIKQLASSLLAYQKIFSVKKSFDKQLKEFKEELQKIDPNALESEENLWSIIIGLLIQDEEYSRF